MPAQAAVDTMLNNHYKSQGKNCSFIKKFSSKPKRIYVSQQLQFLFIIIRN